jgi:hypothetical protein
MLCGNEPVCVAPTFPQLLSERSCLVPMRTGQIYGVNFPLGAHVRPR